jgi:hypothetical protein
LYKIGDFANLAIGGEIEMIETLRLKIRNIAWLLCLLLLAGCFGGETVSVDPLPSANPEPTETAVPTPTIGRDRPGITIKNFDKMLEESGERVFITNRRIYPSELEEGGSPLVSKPGLVYEAEGNYASTLVFVLYEFETEEAANKVQLRMDELAANDDLVGQDHFTNGYLMMWIPDKEYREKYSQLLMSMTP